IFHLPVLCRYLRTMYLGLQSRWQSENRRRHFYWRMMFESADISMLRLLETFLKSAPQLVLQLSIMVHQNYIEPLQGLSASASLVSLAWTLASYQKVLRDSREDKLPMSYKGAMVQILWHLFTIAARAIAFALFASVFQLYFGIFIVTHWCIMTFWIIQGETDFCMSKWEEIIYNMVVGIIYIFCWFNVKEGRSRCRMSIYYIITLSENAAMTGLWYWHRSESISESNALIIVCVVTSSFALGVFFMFIYYCLLHPNGTIFATQSTGCMCREEATAVPGGAGDVVTSPPRSLPRTTGAEREGVPGDRDSCVPVFQVRPSVPPTPVPRAPRTEGPVIRIDLPRKKYPAWDAHFIDRRLRKTILALEYSSPTTPRLQYRSVGTSQELLEYETTV
uniref:XK-related protein n=1 Tax=Anolis carolinensis TaxID=28377 RepID=H9GNW0_ANOCA